MGSVIDNSVEKKVVSDAASSMAMHEMFVSEITENASASKMWVYTYKLILCIYPHVYIHQIKDRGGCRAACMLVVKAVKTVFGLY